ncbi:hypothetical protein ACIRL2_45755 [Embleya sp. NPDC127516]|uniref:hypothetical protein n=1 Tax=Embleya sp. NPDC127516 TaxID=3363990 RepID=UPI0037F17B0B
MAQPTIRRITIVHPDGRKEYKPYSDGARDQDAALGLLVRIRDGKLPVHTFHCLMSDGSTR